MVWHPQNVPEKALETRSVLIGAKFDPPFSANAKRISLGTSPEYLFFGLEERMVEKIGSGYTRVNVRSLYSEQVETDLCATCHAFTTSGGSLWEIEQALCFTWCTVLFVSLF